MLIHGNIKCRSILIYFSNLSTEAKHGNTSYTFESIRITKTFATKRYLQLFLRYNIYFVKEKDKLCQLRSDPICVVTQEL
jgi:hypothetical protein